MLTHFMPSITHKLDELARVAGALIGAPGIAGSTRRADSFRRELSDAAPVPTGRGETQSPPVARDDLAEMSLCAGQSSSPQGLDLAELALEGGSHLSPAEEIRCLALLTD